MGVGAGPRTVAPGFRRAPAPHFMGYYSRNRHGELINDCEECIRREALGMKDKVARRLATLALLLCTVSALLSASTAYYARKMFELRVAVEQSVEDGMDAAKGKATEWWESRKDD